METTVKCARIKGGNSGVDFCRASRPLFFLFGDSITQYSSKLDPLGWGVLLADAYTSEFRSADIINRGFSGYNSRWALAILPQLIAQHGGAPPALVTIFFGANDCVIPTARQYVPRAEFKDNLVRIVALVREAWPDVVVVLITPPPVDVDKWDGTKGHLTKGQRSLKNAEDYAVATREAAAAAGCSCLDLFARIKAYEGGDSAGAVAVAGAGGWGKAWKTCLVDGLHLAETGNRLLFHMLLEVLEALAPGLGPRQIPIHFPHHSDIPEDDPRPYLT